RTIAFILAQPQRLSPLPQDPSSIYYFKFSQERFMKRVASLALILALFAPLTFAAKKHHKQQTAPATGGATQAELNQMAARLAPTELRVDPSPLSPGDQKALAKLIEASRILNDIFLSQLYSGNQALYEQLKKDKSTLGKARLKYFWINKSPWSDLD